MSNYRNVGDDIYRVEMDQNQRDLLTSTLSNLEDKVKLNAETEEEIIRSADEAYDNYKEEYAKSMEIKFPDVEPIGATVVLSTCLMNMMEQGKYMVAEDMTVNTIESFGNMLSETQYVVAVGPDCRQVKVGDKVKVRFSDFYKVVNPNSINRKEQFDIDIQLIGDYKYVFCHEGNIKYVYIDQNIKDNN